MNTALTERWAEFTDEIKQSISAQQYDTWFACIAPVNIAENKLILSVPSRFVSNYIEEKYLDLMTNAVTKVFGNNIEVGYKIGAVNDAKQTAEIESHHTKNVLDEQAQTTINESKEDTEKFDSQLCDIYTFDNFIEGDSNRLARSVGQAIAQNPAKTFNPFFIYGPSGCGKTHLVNAIGQYTKQLHPEMRVLYIPAHLFYVQFANATRNNQQPDFIKFYQTIDMLIIDDVHELSGKTSTQNAFFHIFNHLHLNNKQLIFTSDHRPAEITGLEDRLLTRFKWGLQAEIEKPDKALRRAVMLYKVKERKMNVPDSVVTYIADNVNESIRDIEGILNSINAFALVYNMPINMKVVDQILPKFVNVNVEPLSVNDIKRIICKHYHISDTELCSESRRQPLSQIRQIAIYFASKLTQDSTVQIGQALGGRKHSTIIHSINHIQSLMETDKRLRTEIGELEDELARI
ncbi:MAG: chromosomal replication initiator protein DnaA [Prevotellaceae bacterium]|nr:chromosomal replication initiator protein DnaA [Candidatus Colivivens equi]